MKVDGVPLENLRTRVSEKWSTFDPDVLPMPVAEMDFELAAPIRELYPRFEEWRSFRKRLDPDRKFVNGQLSIWGI